jgi:phosphoglycolate phosphatase
VRYRLVIFDFDGTLADSFGLFMRVVNDLADEHGFKRIEAHELDDLRAYSARQMVRHLEVPLWKMPAIGASMRRRMAEVIDEVAPFEGVDALLERLTGRGAKLAVVTSNSEENVRRVLGEAAGRIDFYECGASVFGKRAKLRKALRRSGAAAGEAVAVGDEIRDAEAAAREGIAFAGVAGGYTTPDALRAHASAGVFASVDALAEWLG